MFGSFWVPLLTLENMSGKLVGHSGVHTLNPNPYPPTYKIGQIFTVFMGLAAPLPGLKIGLG